MKLNLKFHYPKCLYFNIYCFYLLFYSTEKMEQEYLEDLKQRISLNANHLPSICFYTIFNTYQRFTIN